MHIPTIKYNNKWMEGNIILNNVCIIFLIFNFKLNKNQCDYEEVYDKKKTRFTE